VQRELRIKASYIAGNRKMLTEAFDYTWFYWRGYGAVPIAAAI